MVLWLLLLKHSVQKNKEKEKITLIAEPQIFEDSAQIISPNWLHFKTEMYVAILLYFIITKKFLQNKALQQIH